MTDKELVMFCYLNMGWSSFTGNEVKAKLKLNNNQIHLQLFRASKKFKQLNRWVKENVVYYYIDH